VTAGSLKCCLYLRRVGVIQAEALSIGNHVLEGQLCLASLPPAVFEEIIEPYLRRIGSEITISQETDYIEGRASAHEYLGASDLRKSILDRC